MGQPPFIADSPIGVLMKQIDADPAPLRQSPRLGEIPQFIAATIMANLDKSPDRRATDASAFAQALRVAAARSQIAIESCEFSTDLWQTAHSLNQKPLTLPASTTEHPLDTRSS